MRKQTLVYMAVVWTLVIVACASSAITMAVCGINIFPANAQTSYRDEEISMEDRYSRLEQVRRQLSDYYYVEVDDEELMLGAINGMTEALDDPYTFYYTPDEMSSMNRHTQGHYEGVGMLLSLDKDGRLTVLRVFKDSPAKNAGVLPGDVVTAVNDIDLTAGEGSILTRATNEIQQSGDETIGVTVLRDGETISLEMKNAAIDINRVEYALIDEDVGYIAIYEFMGDDVEGFEEAMQSLRQAGVTKLILDVRSNPGGLLDDVVTIADYLMPEGLIVYTLDRYKTRDEFFSDSDYWQVDIAVLINGSSASASEILAGALKDTGRAVVIGETTFGKGIVQTVIPFPDNGSGMQLTTAEYYTPSGKSIHGVGITPDIEVRQEYMDAYMGFENDAQFKTAYEWLVNYAPQREVAG
ncbi:MAG: S41 family peptidase [Clostridia bacterium]|nr:S41 family peptidase [Clostridia bacterium]